MHENIERVLVSEEELHQINAVWAPRLLRTTPAKICWWWVF